MGNFNQDRFRQQVSFLRRQFLQDGDLPFTNVLSEQIVSQALTASKVVWNDSIYPPLVTLWVFLSQVLSADHSCRAAVARLLTHRLSQGQSECSPETGAYCQARKRLPEEFFSDVAQETGQALDKSVQSDWLWKNRRVYLFDGSTVTMPDTPENQNAYPQHDLQKPGLGFPLARVAAIFSLSCGAIIDLGICRYAGKGQGELSVFRTLWHFFRPGDVVLTDRLYCTWRELCTLKQRGVDSVSGLQAMRKADFRKGKRLGKEDHLVQWPRPQIRSLSWQAQKLLPEFLTVRECRIHIKQAGFRSQAIVVVTTLLDVEKFTKEDIGELYRARWNVELDLRSIKSTMQMHDLRCKTPELVRKEIWTHVLAYNLIRTVMAQAASEHDIQPRTISFKGAMQTLEAFQPVVEFSGERNSEFRQELYNQLLKCIASHRVANRPDRFEPRKRKRRFKLYDFLDKPRNEAKLDMLKGVKEK
ncbi:IS4 family transposase [Adhaeretor mobilis]|uniref:Transposase DDE domain protein n=1 Tax=Adhaeretor mobilis TaxID=1930276 RepID=A0A517MXC3_9BACT|nr:IS4 family transposase [Adhaeretor mobilis]QDS99457.1 Transposase DDE domain protein [Adhaeretor mobilis]